MDALYNVLDNQITRHPAMQVMDVYKLLYQAALGSEHAGLDEKLARQQLERELAEMGPGPEEPLFEPISPDGQIARVHLRPYIRAGKDPDALLGAFVRTANEWRGSVETLRAYGQTIARLVEAENLPIHPDELVSFLAGMEAQDFPAVHHSATYLKLYCPAYRVVAKQYLEEP